MNEISSRKNSQKMVSDELESISDESELNKPKPDEKPKPSSLVNKYLILEIFSYLIYLLSVGNILYLILIYFNVASTPRFSLFQTFCANEIDMVVFLDLILTISTIAYFTKVILYLRNVG